MLDLRRNGSLPVTALDLDALLALREQATQGEWATAPGFGGREDVIAVAHGGVDCFTVAEALEPADAALIVAAVNALPGLCAEVERLRAEVERLQSVPVLMELAAASGFQLDEVRRFAAALSDGGDR